MDKKKKEQWPPHLWPQKYVEVHGKKVKVIMREEGSRQGYVHGKVEFGKEDCCYVVCWDDEYGVNLYKFERKDGKVRAFCKHGPGDYRSVQYPESNNAYNAACGGTIVDSSAW